MKAGLRQSMAWLHTWVGLLAGWLLLVIFLTGSASYYRSEITAWMHPELSSGVAIDETRALAQARTWLEQHAAGATSWLIDLPNTRLPATQVMWQTAGEGRYRSELLDLSSGQAVASRKTFGGDFFYGFHFQLNLPAVIGRWIVGLASLLMLIALVSGVIIHRRIFKDFFTLRPGKGQRSWLDAHNSLSVLMLPFHLLITYTGLVTLMFMYLPWGIDLLYGQDRGAFFREVRDFNASEPPTAQRQPLHASASLLEQAHQRWGDGHIARVSISAPGAANARIELIRDTSGQLSSRPERLVFDGVNGQLLDMAGPAAPIKAFYGVLYGLHLGHFADPLLRALLFLCGLGGSAMIATGLHLWIVKRRGHGAARRYRRLEALNTGFTFGLPLAMAALLWANRLIPTQLPGREVREVQVFFCVWLVALVHAQCRPALRTWREQALACSLVFAGLPLLDLFIGRYRLDTVDIGGGLLGAGFALGFWHLRRQARTHSPGHRLQ